MTTQREEQVKALRAAGMSEQELRERGLIGDEAPKVRASASAFVEALRSIPPRRRSLAEMLAAKKS
jgi:hypothetical protein